MSKTINSLRNLKKKTKIFGIMGKLYYSCMYVTPSTGCLFQNNILPFILILWRFKAVF